MSSRLVIWLGENPDNQGPLTVTVDEEGYIIFDCDGTFGLGPATWALIQHFVKFEKKNLEEGSR